MQVTIKSRNLEVTESLRSYIEGKLDRLDRYLPNIDEARVELAVQHAKSAEDRQIAQLTLRGTNGVILRAEERSADMRASIDAALDKMSRQIKRYKGKHWQSQTRVANGTVAGVAEIVEETESDELEYGDAVIRTKTFQTRPMDIQEAIEQMELLGHDFFVFFNATNDGFNVIYRRRDGGYGLLIPELA
jgi:putative sigma-54 modulation protein